MDEDTLELLDKGIIKFNNGLYKIKFKKVEERPTNRHPNYLVLITSKRGDYLSSVKKLECWTNLCIGVTKGVGLWMHSRANPNSYWEWGDGGSYIRFWAIDSIEDRGLAERLQKLIPDYAQTKQREFERS